MSYTVSEVSICNQALTELGADPIASLNEQTSRAIRCNAVFDNLRRELLAVFPWSFATKRVELPQNTEAPLFGYQYQYTLPSDCMYLWEVYEDENHQKVGNQIQSNRPTCKVTYIYDNADTAQWSPTFVSVFVAALRYKLTYSITNSGSEQERAKAAFIEKLEAARFLDTSESTQGNFAEHDDVLLNARY